METTNKKSNNKLNIRFLIILALIVGFGGYFGIKTYVHSQHHEETDDAQIEADITPVLPRVGGYVSHVMVKDNQLVKAGDTLMLIDDRDYRIRLHQAEAALLAAESNLMAADASTQVSVANVASARTGIATIDAQIKTAEVNLWRTTNDLERYENLLADHSITKQQYEQALAAKQTAERQLDVLKQQRITAEKQTAASATQTRATAKQIDVNKANIAARKADVENAELNLGYTVITAATDGKISRVNIQPGQLVQPGQNLFSLVHTDDKWVVANFKETQLDKMLEGQKVIIKVDAFPGKKFEGKIASFSPATGARFSLLPPDNASGNFVKVVQRVPVKITLADNANAEAIALLRPGMNVTVDVELN